MPIQARKNSSQQDFNFFFLNSKITLRVGSWVVSVVTLITIAVLQKHYVI